MEELIDLIASRTGLNEGEVRQVLFELRDSVVFYNLQGRPVKLEGLGTYRPVIELDGKLKVGHRADMDIKNRLNTPGDFRGEIANRENIGKTGDDLVAMWDEAHPDDLVG